jgi:2-oxoisovalerate dehydrogenase E2 component (dihydrolipoyl transacylase)
VSEDFRLPDLGEGLLEAEIVQWMVAEGDEVALNQTLAEVETAKAVVELPSPVAGTVARLHAAAGETVPVGAPLVSFGGGAATQAKAPTATPNLVGYGATDRAAGRPQRRARGAARAATADTTVLEAAPHDVVREHVAPEGILERPRSTPPVRKLAKDLGVDLALVAASVGMDHLVTRTDVEEYAALRAHRDAGTPSATRPAAPEGATAPVRFPDVGRETRVPIRGVRKHTAAAMVRSAFTAPHASVFLTVDVTATTELLAELKADRSLDGHRIGILAVTAKAVCLALRRTPGLGSAWDDAAQEIVQRHYVDLGIAAATERGLVVPHVADADRLSLVELADAIADVVHTARSGRSAPAALSGGTFTITNIGVFGVDAGTPILNPGEAGILGLGAVRRTPWEHDGAIALRDVLTLSLSFDHRLVDGAEAARFLADVGAVLRAPGRTLLLA